MSLVVSDTEPVHYLVLAGLDDTLPRLFSAVFIPGAVYRELLHPSAPERLRAWAAPPPPWLEVREPKLKLETQAAGVGERAAIALAIELAAAALLVDDRRARSDAVA